MPPAVKLAAANARGQRSILTLSPRKLIRNLPLTHPLGLTLSLPLNRPSGFPNYVAAAQLASFPSMSSAPVELPEGDTSLALAHYQAGFQPLLYGIVVALILTVFLRETAPASRRT